MNSFFRLTFALFVTTLLSGCFGEDNKLIGSWQIDAEALKQQPVGPLQYRMTISKPPMEFTKDSYIEGSNEIKVAYKVETGRVGVVANLFGTESTSWYKIVDDNTITEQVGKVIRTYRRVGAQSSSATAPQPTQLAQGKSKATPADMVGKWLVKYDSSQGTASFTLTVKSVNNEDGGMCEVTSDGEAGQIIPPSMFINIGSKFDAKGALIAGPDNLMGIDIIREIPVNGRLNLVSFKGNYDSTSGQILGNWDGGKFEASRL